MVLDKTRDALPILSHSHARNMTNEQLADPILYGKIRLDGGATRNNASISHGDEVRRETRQMLGIVWADNGQCSEAYSQQHYQAQPNE
jgi:hypothetical protein